VSYVVAGYLVTFIGLGAYALSLKIRRRRVDD
jgi:CcmD family protein